MLELIDLDDGRIDEWEELFEPSITTLDFTRKIFDRNTSKRETVSYDPSDLDFQIWLVWNDTHNRLYVSGRFADDIHVREPSSINQGPDVMFLYVDGDYSGGQYNFLTGDRYRDNFVSAQTYSAPFFAQPELSLGLNYNSFGEPFEFSWAGEFPYAYGGDGAEGENPIVWNVEFFITPFDLLDSDPENSTISQLRRGKVIGFYTFILQSGMESR